MSKLTLSIDGAVVRRAKRFAARQGTSLSRLVERYLRLLARPEPQTGAGNTPVLARLRGALRGSAGGASAYRRHLERKYR